MKDLKIIAFGAGNSGVNLLERIGEHVVCVVDNDVNKHGKTLKDKLIISPSQIDDYEFDAIVIASMFENEIKAQLLELGYGDKVASYKNAAVSAYRDSIQELRFLKDEDLSKPLLRTMHLNLTSACNIQCRTCRPEDFKYKATYLERDTIEKIVDDVFDELTHLRLDSSGELTLSPHLEYVLEEATKRNISIFISTNGTRINKEFAELIVSSTVESMQVSLDSPDKETNEWIRKGAKHDKILEGAKNLVAAKKKLGKHYPEIHFHGAILQQNIHQLKDMVQLAYDIGINGVTLAYGFVHSYMDPMWSVFFDRELCNLKVNEAREHANSLGMFFNAPMAFNSEQNKVPQEKYCQYLFNWTYVDPSGEIFPCCTGAGEYVLGDAKEEKISDIWVGEKYQKLRDTYNTENPEWDKCSRCYMLSGWDVDDYKVHFDPNHWNVVKNQLEKESDPMLICRA